MGFNYAKEKELFDKKWKKTAIWYRNAGFDEDGIQAMHDYDWVDFCKRRIYRMHEQDLPMESFDDDDDSSTLFQKFRTLSYFFDESSLSGRYDWIETIDNPVLVARLVVLNDSDKELLTQKIFDGFTLEEIAILQGCSHQAISKKLKRIKKLLI